MKGAYETLSKAYSEVVVLLQSIGVAYLGEAMWGLWNCPFCGCKLDRNGTVMGFGKNETDTSPSELNSTFQHYLVFNTVKELKQVCLVIFSCPLV